MDVYTCITLIFLIAHYGGGDTFSVKPYATCGGVPCVCYDELGCFSIRPECGENSNSLLPESPDKIGTKFLLFTSKSQANGKLITYSMKRSDFVSAGFDTTAETKVLIHGFANDANSPAVKDVKDAFLKTGKYNVIIVEWKTGILYPQSGKNIRVVAKQVQLLLQQLKNEVSVSYGNLHLLGHSLGAHTAGLVGPIVSGNIGRISGLDPAGPDFQSVGGACRLDSSDASFVDVIHTDKTLYGTNVESGDIDFWPNDGTNQPGCGVVDGCSHGRSAEYFAISIEGACQYNTKQCGSSSCSNCPKMGIDANLSSKRGNFCLTTVANYPYC